MRPLESGEDFEYRAADLTVEPIPVRGRRASARCRRSISSSTCRASCRAATARNTSVSVHSPHGRDLARAGARRPALRRDAAHIRTPRRSRIRPTSTSSPIRRTTTSAAPSRSRACTASRGRFEMRRLRMGRGAQRPTRRTVRRRRRPGGWRTACATRYAGSAAGRSDAVPICSGSWKPSRHGMASPRHSGPNTPTAPHSAEPSPRACVLLLAYNQQETIESAIDSVLGQRCEPIEIVLSDDASSDRSFELMQAAAERYRGPHRVRVRVATTTNLGIGQHYNRLVRETRAPLLVTAAGDDISTPDRVVAPAAGVGRHRAARRPDRQPADRPRP